jgi:hypothetical protein
MSVRTTRARIDLELGEDAMRIVTVLVVALLALPPTALASDRFADPRGDPDGDGPDISAVTLSHTDAVLTIAVDFASAPPLAYDEDEQYTDMLLIGIHTDDDLSRDDVEFFTGVHGVDLTRGMVVRGGERGIVGSADVTVEGTTVTLEVERAVLEDPDAIAVEIAAGREYVDEDAGGGEGDVAPASGPHRYVLTDGGASSWLWPLVGSGLAAVAIAALVALTARRSVRRRRSGTLSGRRRGPGGRGAAGA